MALAVAVTVRIAVSMVTIRFMVDMFLRFLDAKKRIKSFNVKGFSLMMSGKTLFAIVVQDLAAL